MLNYQKLLLQVFERLERKALLLCPQINVGHDKFFKGGLGRIFSSVCRKFLWECLLH